MKFVTAYTPTYADEARQCVDAAHEFGIDVEAVALPDLGSWRRNCAQKPGVILDCMSHNPAQSVVWLDADARVRQKPTLLYQIGNCDVAAHYRNGEELLSSLLWFSPTPEALTVLVAWRNACRDYISSPFMQQHHVLFEQQELQRVLERVPCKVMKLPSEYARVFDDPRMGAPVVEQMQASRRLGE